MDGEGNNAKNIVKEALKSSLKTVLIVVVIAALILGLIPMLYVILKDDFDKLSEKTSTYSSEIDSNGNIIYVKEDEDGNKTQITPEEMAEDLEEILKDYIGGDEEERKEKIQYLIGAEAVTKMPYIENSGELVGQIKFYRFDNENDASNAYETNTEGNEIVKDSYRLTYIDPSTFESQKQNYESSGNEEVFKHFTMNDESNIVIAYGRKETKNITTGDSTYAADSELTLETVKEASGESGYSGDYKNGFSMVKYTIFEKSIDYLSLVEQYVMPANLLYSLLIQTKDINFVEAIAGLAYENEIAVAIYDNASEANANQTYIYKKLLDMNATTKLDFSKISTSEPDAPEIKPSNLYGETYSKVPHRCELVTDNGRASHKMYYYRTSDGATSSQYTNDGFYAKGLNDQGQITELTTESDAQQFIVSYHQQINAKAIPTVGIMLADTWIARWEATYYKKDLEPNDSSSEDTTIRKELIQEYTQKEEVLNAFETETSNTISTQLSEHGDNLVTSAIDRIAECTDFSVTVSAEKITAEDVTVATKKNLLSSHKGECSQCQSKINSWWANQNRNNDDRFLFSDIDYSDNDRKLASLTIARPMVPILVDPTIHQIYSAVISGALKGTIVETHLNDEIDSYVEKKNAEAEEAAKENAEEKEEKRKENFKEKLEEQITYTQTLTGNKYDVITKSSSSYERTASEYKRNETIETTQIGEKFSEVFNDSKFYDARQAILERDKWLWEYIRKNEDTAKLENILRYLLNIATDSNRFGTFSEEEIKELFKAFEPKEIKIVVSYYGGTIQEKLWFSLREAGFSEYATAGVMGNIWGESGFISNNLEQTYEESLGYTDETYTEAIDSGTYTRAQFTNDSAGYGLAQWTWWSLKEGLYDFAKSRGVSIADEELQIEYLIGNITFGGGADGYAQCTLVSRRGYTIEDWLNADSPELAGAAFMMIFENPGHSDTSAREAKAREYYEEFHGRTRSGFSAATVAQFAKQFDGMTASEIGIFNYKSSTGKQFYAADWCAMFVSYCFDQCGLIDAIDGVYFGCTTKVNEIKGTELWRDAADYIPQPGDVIFYTDDGRTSYHTGIVVSCNGTTITTVEGNTADYVGENGYLNSTCRVWDNKASVGGRNILGYLVPNVKGRYEEIDDKYRYGIYTSSSGRRYVEWKQTTANSYGQLELFTDGLMGNSGCNVYGYTMLLNSVGIDINPGITHTAYKSFSSMNSVGTMKKLLSEYGVDAEVKELSVGETSKFISVLRNGRGILTWVGPGYGNLYTRKFHWLVVADIRATQLVSEMGYDVFIVTSSKRGRGWQPIETIINNFESPRFMGYYIQD